MEMIKFHCISYSTGNVTDVPWGHNIQAKQARCCNSIDTQITEQFRWVSVLLLTYLFRVRPLTGK
jgi:hypothetical protein